MQGDFGKMMRDAQKSLQKMQQDMASMQAELAVTSVEGSSGGGMVTVTVSGMSEVKSIKIKPEVVDPSDIETLEDLILMATKDALTKAHNLMTEKTGKLTQGLSLPPGLGM